jgi:hypothetical protein
MTSEKMTVHKALAELKLLDDRILKAIKSTEYCVANKHSNDKIRGVSVEEYSKQMQGGYDKAVDLIERRKSIKRAVVLSNAVTKVKIAGKEYTVAEAIEMKNHGIDFDGTLMEAMRKNYNLAMAVIKEQNGKELEERADQYVTAIYGQKEGKTNTADIEKVKEDFLKSNQFELVDPLSVLDKINSLEEKISDFMAEVDAALSVSNALTEIEVNY